MFNKYKNWLYNAPIRTKFVPMQIMILMFMLAMGLISVISVYMLNSMSQNIFTRNVEKMERLNEIVQTMYQCRVLGRDILFLDDTQQQLELYGNYIIAFDELDSQMLEFEAFVSENKKETFAQIIEQKNVYKDSMLLSADIHIQGGDFDEALEALRSVTPIANEFFGSIDTFLSDEKLLMEQAMADNNLMVIVVFITVAISNTVAAVLIFVLFGSFARVLCSSLVSLEESVLAIAETNDMKRPIPPHLFTNDEVGLIAKVVDKFRVMLLAHSYNDPLTGGLNVTAYHERLTELFDNNLVDSGKVKEFWLLVLDMNNLKLINDKLGHVEGDSALKQSHKILVSCFDEFGEIYRIGGDEFVAILQNCTKEQVDAGIALMESRIEEANKNNDIKFSLAWGYENFIGKTKEEFDDYFKSADKKMYKNKDAMKQMRMRPLASAHEEKTEEKSEK